MRRFSFYQDDGSGFFEWKLHLFLISDTLQESVIKTDVLASFVPTTRRYFFKGIQVMPPWGKGFWKFNNYLTSNAENVEKMENLKTLHMLEPDKITVKHHRWEYLKYEIGKFAINFSKSFIKEENKDQYVL